MRTLNCCHELKEQLPLEKLSRRLRMVEMCCEDECSIESGSKIGCIEVSRRDYLGDAAISRDENRWLQSW